MLKSLRVVSCCWCGPGIPTSDHISPYHKDSERTMVLGPFYTPRNSIPKLLRPKGSQIIDIGIPEHTGRRKISFRKINPKPWILPPFSDGCIFIIVAI